MKIAVKSCFNFCANFAQSKKVTNLFPIIGKRFVTFLLYIIIY